MVPKRAIVSLCKIADLALPCHLTNGYREGAARSNDDARRDGGNWHWNVLQAVNETFKLRFARPMDCYKMKVCYRPQSIRRLSSTILSFGLFNWSSSFHCSCVIAAFTSIKRLSDPGGITVITREKYATRAVPINRNHRIPTLT